MWHESKEHRRKVNKQFRVYKREWAKRNYHYLRMCDELWKQITPVSVPLVIGFLYEDYHYPIVLREGYFCWEGNTQLWELSWPSGKGGTGNVELQSYLNFLTERSLLETPSSFIAKPSDKTAT